MVKMSLVQRKLVFGISNRSNTNWAIQPQKTARGLKFLIYEEQDLYYSIYPGEIKALISCAVTTELIWVFVVAFARSRFSHDAAQM